MFTPETRSAIISTANTCMADMPYADASDASIVAETALDASRLTLFGHPDADAEVEELIKEHGWLPVRKAAEKFVPTV